MSDSSLLSRLFAVPSAELACSIFLVVAQCPPPTTLTRAILSLFFDCEFACVLATDVDYS